MTLLKFKPRKSSSIPSEFTSLIDELLKNDHAERYETNNFVPRVNILDNDKAFEIQMELAGFNKKNIEIKVENDLLTVQGENNLTNGLKYHLHQIREGKFTRSFYLPDDVSTDKVVAKFENGILYLQIPKDEVKQTKHTINVG